MGFYKFCFICYSWLHIFISIRGKVGVRKSEISIGTGQSSLDPCVGLGMVDAWDLEQEEAHGDLCAPRRSEKGL